MAKRKSAISAREHMTHHKKGEHHNVSLKRNVAELQMVFFSLMNESDFRNNQEWSESWLKKWNQMKKEILALPSGDLVYSSFTSKYGNLGRIPN